MLKLSVLKMLILFSVKNIKLFFKKSHTTLSNTFKHSLQNNDSTSHKR